MYLEPLPALQDNYIWLLADAAGAALVVDPGEAGPVNAALQRRQLHLEAILLTHHHPDHVGGAAHLQERHGCTVYGPDDDRIAGVDQRVGDGDLIELAAPHARFRVYAVPGHTRTHVAFVGEGLLFCGDTLFSLGCGRLFEGTPAQMLSSLDRLAALPDGTRVCCGHEYTLANAAFARTVEPNNAALGQSIEQARRAMVAGRASVPTRMQHERAANPFLRVDTHAVRQWAAAMEHGTDDRVQRFAALRAAKDQFRA